MSERPIIGSQYHGPDFDRPCVRQLPREWIIDHLEEPAFGWFWTFLADAIRALVSWRIR